MLEWAAQGDGGITVPGGISEKIVCGIQHHSLVDKVALGHRLDIRISKAFSNPADFVIWIL